MKNVPTYMKRELILRIKEIDCFLWKLKYHLIYTLKEAYIHFQQAQLYVCNYIKESLYSRIIIEINDSLSATGSQDYSHYKNIGK